MPRMTGGEALARQLVREGVKIVFGLPGVQLYGALAALRDERVRFLTTRHEQATTYMADGRPRPVHLEFPPDVREEEGEATLLPPAETDRAAAPEPTIARAAQMLLAAQRPVIYAGGGAVTGDAHEALGAIAEHLQAGVATTAEGKGVISDANDLSLRAGLWPKNPPRRWLHAAHLLLAVGSRLPLARLPPTQ